MKAFRTMVLWMLLGGSAQASSWPDLWYRRDQQGEHALRAGDSKRAAELFADPRRQAYAQLQAEQYAAAAKRLEPFADAASQYNRGNALAKNGDLQGALSAYDSALKHADLESSLRRDAQHNRDLVARHLQTRQDQHPSSGEQSQSKDKQNGKPQGDETKGASGASDSSKPPATAGSANPSPGDKNKPAEGEPRTSTPTSPSEPSSSSPAQSKAGDEQRQADQSPQSTRAGDASSRQQAPASASRSGNEELNSREPAIGDSSRPQTEQQLALEQWLRQIPDDPGGLLRRKFMIEHLMKQQQVQP